MGQPRPRNIKSKMTTQAVTLSEIFDSPQAWILDALIRESPVEISIEEIAAKTASTKKTVNRYLPRMIEQDLVTAVTTLEPRYSTDGKPKTKYKLNWNNPMARMLYRAAATISSGSGL
jgi:response regulator of citrate/malate metabolism